MAKIPNCFSIMSGGSAPKLMTVAQAYFKYGGSTYVQKLTATPTVFLDDDDEDEEVEVMDALASSVSSSADFAKFWVDVVNGAGVVLWPESTALALPRFLLDSGYYEALLVR